jgi:hypothetical protein
MASSRGGSAVSNGNSIYASGGGIFANGFLTSGTINMQSEDASNGWFDQHEPTQIPLAEFVASCWEADPSAQALESYLIMPVQVQSTYIICIESYLIMPVQVQSTYIICIGELPDHASAVNVHGTK